MSEVVKYTNADEEKAQRLLLQRFQEALSAQPKSDEVVVNKYANGTRYIPISHVEMLLDEYYFGLWETVDFTHSVVVNEIVGQLTLRVFHPIGKVWISRIGTASTQIRQEKGASISDVNAKIKNALEMDMPHLKSDCLKNAAKSLGPRFGRDLNRGHIDNFKGLIPKDAAPANDGVKNPTTAKADEWAAENEKYLHTVENFNAALAECNKAKTSNAVLGNEMFERLHKMAKSKGLKFDSSVEPQTFYRP